MDRRSFLAASAAGSAGLAGLSSGFAADEVKKAKLKKALKYSMIKHPGSVEEKLKAVRSIGFLGVEIDVPGPLKKEEVKAAAKAADVVVHGVIDSMHWGQPLSSPDEEVRAKGLAALKEAIETAGFLGCDTVLLVPGVARNGVSYQECWDRSQAEVKKVLPLAEKNKVKIAIEVVWNDFLTKPEQLVDYVDAFQSPWVGAYFDASNMLKYGVPAATWIRKLGKRMLKLDFKGFHVEKKSWVKIGEGSEDWPEILKACAEVGYNSWATVEIGGGDLNYLKEVSQKMDQFLELS